MTEYCFVEDVARECYLVDKETGAREITSGMAVCSACGRVIRPKTKDCSKIKCLCRPNPLQFGTWLEKVLKWVGVRKNAGCRCLSRQRKLNQVGLLLLTLVWPGVTFYGYSRKSCYWMI